MLPHTLRDGGVDVDLTRDLFIFLDTDSFLLDGADHLLRCRLLDLLLLGYLLRRDVQFGGRSGRQLRGPCCVRESADY